MDTWTSSGLGGARHQQTDRGAGVEGSEEYFTKIGVETGSIGSTKAIWRPGPPLRFGGPVRNKKLGPTLIKSLL
jgi:hypothetical protein